MYTAGCPNGCTRHGQCLLEDGVYRCSCADGWAGTDCSIALELSCNDNEDNDEGRCLSLTDKIGTNVRPNKFKTIQKNILAVTWQWVHFWRWHDGLLGLGMLQSTRVRRAHHVLSFQRSCGGTPQEATAFCHRFLLSARQIPHRRKLCPELRTHGRILRKVCLA